MTEREFDQILGSEPEVTPSKAFAANVMQAVRREAATPPPIGFPWPVVAPAALMAGVILAVLVATPLAESGATAPPGPWGDTWLQSWLGLWNSSSATWIAAALLLTVACVVAPLRLVRGRSNPGRYGVTRIVTRLRDASF